MARRRRFTQTPGVAAATVCALLLAGCGNNYRPVVSAINPVGPAGQPTKYAVAVAIPAVNAPGLLSIIDFSGDTTLSTPSILPNPTYFTLNPGGGTGYAVNQAGALDTFAVTNPTALQTIDVGQTTLLAGATPVSISPFSSSQGTILYITQAGRQSIAALSSNGPSLLQELAVGNTSTPNYVVGTDGSARVYALSSSLTGAAGTATAIETTSTLPTISAQIAVGVNPVYGVVSSDLSRAFVLNRGSGNISVINTVTNALDSTTPTIPVRGALGGSPIWAEYVASLSELVVLNAGVSGAPGSLSIISVPECNSVTVAANPACNQANPTDAVGFGTIVATVPVGIITPNTIAGSTTASTSPFMSVLRDGSRAYVISQSNLPTVCGGQGSVSVVNLSTNQVSSTICGVVSPNNGTSNPTSVYGHPNSIAVTLASPTGKVYVTAPDSQYLTVIRTDTDTVTTHINLQGAGLRVMVTAP